MLNRSHPNSSEHPHWDVKPYPSREEANPSSEGAKSLQAVWSTSGPSSSGQHHGASRRSNYTSQNAGHQDYPPLSDRDSEIVSFPSRCPEYLDSRINSWVQSQAESINGLTATKDLQNLYHEEDKLKGKKDAPSLLFQKSRDLFPDQIAVCPKEVQFENTQGRWATLLSKTSADPDLFLEKNFDYLS